MKTRAELLRSKGYWTAMLQMDLFKELETFMSQNHMNKTQLAEHLGCTKGYVSQILNGDFDHKLSKFVELSLAIGKIPEIKFTDVEDYIEDEQKIYQVTINFTGSSFCEGQFSASQDAA